MPPHQSLYRIRGVLIKSRRGEAGSRTLYIVSDPVLGEPVMRSIVLTSKSKGIPADPKDLLSICKQLCEAVRHLHLHGVLLGPLDLDCVYVTRESTGEVRAHLHIARLDRIGVLGAASGSTDGARDDAGSKGSGDAGPLPQYALGSPPFYAPPELVPETKRKAALASMPAEVKTRLAASWPPLARAASSPAQDAWWLGSALYAILTGEMPFAPAESDPLLSQYSHCELGIHASLSGQVVPRDGVSSGAMDLLRRMLAPRPQDRVLPSGALTHPWLGLRRAAVVRWRQAVEAKRDAGCVFRAARDGRPLELQKRLVLGRLAGGLETKGEVEREDGGVLVVSPLEAARMGGHAECVRVLEAAMFVEACRDGRY